MTVPSHARIFPGVIAEYRQDDGPLLGVMTGVKNDEGDVLLQHLMVWPKVNGGTMLRMLRDIEIEAWRELKPRRIFLDIEHNHPDAMKLELLAVRRGFKHWHTDTTTTWYVKEREG